MDDNRKIEIDREVVLRLQTFVKAAHAVMEACDISLQRGIRAVGAAKASTSQAIELLDDISRTFEQD
ncbi:MAG TPA: hypothetical protein VK463_19365 [Desulfomonilaceae bacterium]|nr:hypothetical protein [Desulfomonilaceae bacterium]